MRDLQKDLLICEKATLGPWMAVDWFVYTDDAGIRIADCDFGSDGNPDGDENSAFIVAAREGWPEAISRAIAAEAEVERLKEKNKKLTEIAKNYLNHMRSTPLNDAKFRFIDYIEEVLEGCK